MRNMEILLGTIMFVIFVVALITFGISIGEARKRSEIYFKCVEDVSIPVGVCSKVIGIKNE